MEHLVAEPHSINMSRNTCQYMRAVTEDNSFCTGYHEGYDRCLSQGKYLNVIDNVQTLIIFSMCDLHVLHFSR